MVYSDKQGTIGTNHGHAVTLTAAQQQAGQAVTLTLSGSHTHQLSLSAAEVTAVANGTNVAKDSTSDLGHSHTVTFN